MILLEISKTKCMSLLQYTDNIISKLSFKNIFHLPQFFLISFHSNNNFPQTLSTTLLRFSKKLKVLLYHLNF